MATLSRRTLLLLPLLALCHCDSPSSGGTDAIMADTIVDTSEVTADTTPVELDGTDATTPDVAETDASQDAAGPSNPNVGCRTDSECAGTQVCCTLVNAYTSQCVDIAECHEGLHDACLTDQQCQARRPGEWSVCCHDLRDRNYCAPIAETCQPLMPCESPADCAGNATEVCCSPHPYYGVSMCTSEFFANPDRDCP